MQAYSMRVSPEASVHRTPIDANSVCPRPKATRQRKAISCLGNGLFMGIEVHSIRAPRPRVHSVSIGLPTVPASPIGFCSHGRLWATPMRSTDLLVRNLWKINPSGSRAWPERLRARPEPWAAKRPKPRRGASFRATSRMSALRIHCLEYCWEYSQKPSFLRC